MRQIRTFSDDRLSAFCYSCGCAPDTRDHVPPRVFLDPPFPENVPVVGSCQRCNHGPSKDEVYLACLLEVAACGGTDGKVERPKIKRILESHPALAARLAAATVAESGYIAVEPNR